MSQQGTPSTSTVSPSQFGTDVMRADVARVLAAAFSRIEPWSRYPFTDDQLFAVLNQTGADIESVCIHTGGDPAGAAVIKRSWLGGSYLQFLGLLPSQTARGLGSAFITDWEALSQNRGERNLWVAASTFNTGALRFYQRHGFQPVAKLDSLLRDGFDEILFRKTLV